MGLARELADRIVRFECEHLPAVRELTGLLEPARRIEISTLVHA